MKTPTGDSFVCHWLRQCRVHSTAFAVPTKALAEPVAHAY